MNSWYHAVSAAKKWGGKPEDYLDIEEFIDSSKHIIGDARHRSIYHHTEGVWLCQRVFGVTRDIEWESEGCHHVKPVPVRLIAERHVIEDLGWIPSPADYIKEMTLATWMSGAQKKERALSTFGLYGGQDK